MNTGQGWEDIDASIHEDKFHGAPRICNMEEGMYGHRMCIKEKVRQCMATEMSLEMKDVGSVHATCWPLENNGKSRWMQDEVSRCKGTTDSHWKGGGEVCRTTDEGGGWRE